ncbi:hypothetical protein M569_08102, partial [Genlisea aurea]
TKELRCVYSILAGTLICKIVYDLTNAISGAFVIAYTKLTSQQKLEWNNRGFSTFHSIVVTCGCLYFLFISDLFKDSENGPSIVYRSSVSSDALLGFSLGYFLSDLAMILYYYPALGGYEYIVHHGLSLFSIFQSLTLSQVQFYTMMVLFTEVTTPFVNLRWYLDVSGLKNGKIYLWNGVALFFGWLAARIVLFLYLLYHAYLHFDEVRQVSGVCFYTLFCVPPALAAMNVYWFSKIARGMVKTLAKADHRQ